MSEEMSWREFSRKGGKANAKKNHANLVLMGKQNGIAAREKNGPEYFRKLQRLSVQKRLENKRKKLGIDEQADGR